MSDDPALQRIYALIGKIATSWSEIEWLWYLLFASLMRGTTASKVDAIFYQWDTSAKQRDLVMSVADAVYPNNGKRRHPIRRRIGQLYAKSNDAAGDRNAAIHAVIREEASLSALLLGTKNYQAGSINPRKPNKLAGKKLETELTATAKRIGDLRAAVAQDGIEDDDQFAHDGGDDVLERVASGLEPGSELAQHGVEVGGNDGGHVERRISRRPASM